MSLVTLTTKCSDTPGNDLLEPEAGAPKRFALSDLAIRRGGNLTGQAKIDFELMLSCAIFEEPKCQQCLAKGKRAHPDNC